MKIYISVLHHISTGYLIISRKFTCNDRVYDGDIEVLCVENTVGITDTSVTRL